MCRRRPSVFRFGRLLVALGFTWRTWKIPTAAGSCRVHDTVGAQSSRVTRDNAGTKSQASHGGH